MQSCVGAKLKVGDTIRVWWSSYDGQNGKPEDTITKLTKYDGPLKHLFPDGAQIADFRYAKVGMTIDNRDYYIVLSQTEDRVNNKMTARAKALRNKRITRK